MLLVATHDLLQSFTTFSNASTMQAAQAQDKIGWLFVTKGKVSNEWEKIQEAHYHSSQSRQSARKWLLAGLTTANLFHITHLQWSHRNLVLHEHDAQGLKIKEGLISANSSYISLSLLFTCWSSNTHKRTAFL
jgi:hypothetical protein